MNGTERYYLTLGDSPEQEVTKAEFVRAERAAGFRNTLGQPDEPATAAFSGPVAGRPTSGRTRYVTGEVTLADLPAEGEGQS